MRVLVESMVRRSEWIALVTGVVAAGAIYLLLIQPSIQSFANHDDAVTAKNEAEAELAKAHLEIQALEHEIADGRKQLTTLGGSPPSIRQKDEQIAKATALASRCAVIIDECLPIDTVNTKDYQSVFIRFSARAEFQAIHRFFRRAETELNYIDVTHFAINSAQGPGPSICQVSWTCRISGMPADKPEIEAATQVQNNNVRSLEVAFNGR